MPANLGLVEALPSPDQVPEPSSQPELYGIQGGGEIGYDAEAAERRAAFYVAAELPGDTVLEIQESDGPVADNGPQASEVAEIVSFVDVRTGRTMRYAGSKTVEMAVGMEDDDYKHRGGGGGAYYWFLKTQAEKYHDEGCGCHFCGH